jgi:alpha-L-rhamnosidase
MLGAIDEWFTAALGGIEQIPSSVGYADLLIAPAIVGDLTSVTAPLSHAPRLGDQ